MRPLAIFTLVSSVLAGDHCDFPRVDGRSLTERSFKKQYVEKRRAVVLTNIIDDWPALQRWTPEYIVKHVGSEALQSDHIHEGVLKRIRRLNKGTFHNLTVREMVESHKPTVYFLKPHHPLIQHIKSEIVVPPVLKSIQGFGPSFSFGSSGAWIDFHKHSMSWLAMIYGKKLFAVSEDEPSYLTIQSSPCEVEVQKLMQTCVVKTGEILYIPTDWYHGTCAVGASALAVGYLGTGLKSQLHRRVAAGNVTEFREQFMTERGSSTTGGHVHNQGLFEVAVDFGHVEMAEMLIERRADVSATNETTPEPIHSAAEGGHVSMLRSLIAHRASLYAKNKENVQPIYKAAFHGHSHAIEFLVSRRASVTASDNYGRQPIHGSAMHGDVDGLTWLVNRGASVAAKDAEGYQPLHFAASNGHHAVVESLLVQRASTTAKSTTGMQPLHSAAIYSYADVVKSLVLRKASLTATNAQGLRPLDVAAAQYLSAHSITVRSSYASEAVQHMAHVGHAAVAETLAMLGADVMAQGDEGMRPLEIAAIRGHVAVVRSLAAWKASLSVTTQDGAHLLHLAAAQGHAAVVEFLVSLRASPHVEDGEGMRPLDLAAGANHAAVITALVLSRANVEAKSSEEMPPVHLAALQGHAAAVDRLVFHRASHAATFDEGMQPMHLAALKGHVNVVEMLAKLGADASAKDGTGMQPLDLAAESGHHSVSALLREMHKKMLKKAKRRARPSGSQSRSDVDNIANQNKFGPSGEL